MAHPEVQNGTAAELSAPVITFTAVKTQLLVGAPKANDAVNFYKAAFGAVEVSRALDPKRKADQDQQYLRYAELKLAGFTIFVSDSADSYSPSLYFNLFLFFYFIVCSTEFFLDLNVYAVVSFHIIFFLLFFLDLGWFSTFFLFFLNKCSNFS